MEPLNIGTAPVPQGGLPLATGEAQRPDFLADAAKQNRERALAEMQSVVEQMPPPAQAAVLRRSAEAQALPFTTVLADPERAKPAEPLPWSSYADNQPLADILLDPEKAVLTHDEAHRLARVGDIIRNPLPASRPGQLLESGQLGLEEQHLWTKKGMNGGVLSPEDDARLQAVETRLGLLPPAKGLGEELFGMAPMVLGNFAAVGAGALAGAAVGTIGGPGGAAAGAGLGGKLGSLAYNTDLMVGGAYAEYTRAGLPHDVAWPAAMIVGAVQGGIETATFGLLSKIPAMQLISKVPGSGLLTKANIVPAMSAALKDSKFVELLKGVGHGAAGMGLIDAVQLLGLYAANAAAGGVAQTPSASEAAGRLLHAATLGGAMGGAVGGAGTLLRETVMRVNAGEQSKSAIDAIYKETDKLETPNRAPGVMKEYGDKLAETSPVKFVTLPVAELDALFDGSEKSPELQAWLASPMIAKRLETARTNGTRVLLSLGDFLEHVRPLDKSEVLKDVLALNDELSPKDAKEMKPAVVKARQEMADVKAREKSIEGGPEDLIRADIEKQLAGAGHSAEAARAQAQFAAAGVSTIARRAGEDPWTAYQGAKLKIERRDFTPEEKTLTGAGDKTRGAVFWNPERTNFNVVLRGNASLSTFVHETSHYLLEVMRKFEQHDTIAADLAELRKWAGVEEGKEWHSAALEKFARGMETYLGEGKAPSAKLAEAFAMFKAWVLHVYRTLASLGAPLTDEVRSVMDRMLATKDEIDARRTEHGYFPSEVVVREGDMDAAAQARYRRQFEQGGKLVQEELDRRGIEALKKEKTAEYARIAKETDQDLDKHPVIALRAWLEGKKRTDGGLEIPEFQNRKFDAEAVREKALAAGVMPKVKEHLVERGGLHPDELAPYFGFKNGSEMLTKLAETPARVTLKSQIVKAEMTRRYPAYGPDPSWVERTAIDRLQNEGAIANALELELGVIYRKAGLAPPIAPARVAKLAARADVKNLTYQEANPRLFREAETRALREEQKALASKDFKTAAEAVRRRLYNRAMAAAAEEARGDMDRAKKFVRQFVGEDAQARLGKPDMQLANGERVGSVIRDMAVALVEGFGFKERSDASDRGLGAYYDLLDKAGLPVSIDPDLIEKPIRKWDDLTVLETQAAKDALANLRHIAASLNEIRIGKEKADLAVIAEKVVAEMKANGLFEREGREGEKRSTLRAVRSEIATPEAILMDLSETLHRAFTGSAEEGQFESERRFRQRRAEFKEMRKSQPEGWQKRMKAKHEFVDGIEYTGAEVFAMLLNFSSNRDQLVEGMQRALHRNGWTERSVLDFIHRVFPQESGAYEYAQRVWDFASKSDLKNDSFKVSEAISGVRPKDVEILPVPTPDGGEVTGGYFPVIHDRTVLLKEAEALHADAFAAMQEANPMNLYVGRGFTRERTGYRAPLLLDPTALAAHIYSVDHFISNAEGVIDRHKLLSNPKIKGAIVYGIGLDYWEKLKASNNYIAADGRILTPETLIISKIVNRFVFGNAILSMGGNALSGVNQIVTGLPATLAYLGPKGVPAFARALMDFVRSPFQVWKEVHELSGEVKDKEFHYDRDLRMIIARSLTNEGTWDNLRSQIATTSMAPIVFGQKIVDVITWKAAFRIAASEGKSQADAVFDANTAVRRSQSAASPKDLSAVQRSKDTFYRIATSLASYTFALNDLVMPRQLTKKQLAGATGRLMMLLTMGAVTKALMDAVFPKLEEKDDQRRKGLSKVAFDAEVPGLTSMFDSAMDVLGNVPIVGRPVESVVTGRQPRGAAWVETLLKSPGAVEHFFENKGMSKQDVKTVVDAIGLTAGVPTRHVFFGPTEFFSEYLDGNMDASPWSLFQEFALARPGQKGEK